MHLNVRVIRDVRKMIGWPLPEILMNIFSLKLLIPLPQMYSLKDPIKKFEKETPQKLSTEPCFSQSLNESLIFPSKINYLEN